MKILLVLLMFLNAALFVFGAVQHAGVAIGRFHEPRIIPASIVEGICALSLVWGAIAVLSPSTTEWRMALIGNLIALGAVLLGIVALAMGAGPRTASNDLYHRLMLILIGASLLVLILGRSALNRR
jgi:hypothetical protein